MKLLPEDAVFEILLKLPVRTLLGFRCVCKGWCAVINSSLFQDTHLALRRAMSVDEDFLVFETHPLRRQPNDMFTFYVTCRNAGDFGSFSAASSSNNNNYYFKISGNSSYPINIINHVNGIVCVSDPGEYWFMTWGDITLLNPALRQVRKLPVPDFGEGHRVGTRKAIGFGYDDATNEYKVVVIVTLLCCDTDPFDWKDMVLVYYLSTNSWKILGDMSEFVPECRFSSLLIAGESRCIFSHGSIHFIAYRDCRILTFSMTSELFHKIDFPHDWKDYYYGIVPHLLTVNKSTIALAAVRSKILDRGVSSDDEQVLVEIWVMKEYGDAESWTKQYSIGSSSLPTRLIKRSLSLWTSDKLFLVSEDGDVICYDLSTCQLLEELQLTNAADVLTCNQSFVSIKEPL